MSSFMKPRVPDSDDQTTANISSSARLKRNMLAAE
jgi:hypothetical protein